MTPLTIIMINMITILIMMMIGWLWFWLEVGLLARQISGGHQSGQPDTPTHTRGQCHHDDDRGENDDGENDIGDNDDGGDEDDCDDDAGG